MKNVCPPPFPRWWTDGLSHSLTGDYGLAGTAGVMSTELVQGTPVTPPHAGDARQTSGKKNHPRQHLRHASPAERLLSGCGAPGHVLGALVQPAHGAAVVEGHAAGGEGHVSKHQGHGEDHVIWRKTVKQARRLRGSPQRLPRVYSPLPVGMGGSSSGTGDWQVMLVPVTTAG